MPDAKIDLAALEADWAARKASDKRHGLPASVCKLREVEADAFLRLARAELRVAELEAHQPWPWPWKKYAQCLIDYRAARQERDAALSAFTSGEKEDQP